MKTTKFKATRLVFLFLLASVLGGCAVYEPVPGGSYVANADGSRTYFPGSYTCPPGYTCSSPATYPVAPYGYTYAPTYYGYQPAYVVPSPYIWPPLFFGLGYYYGGYHHGYHGPRR